jgi:hypothetical protein
MAAARERASRAAGLRSFASRGVDRVVDLAQVPPAGLRGPVFHGPAEDRLPVVLLFQPGADEEGVAKTVAAVPQLSSAARVRVVLVLDRPQLVVARRGRVVVELLPDRAAWERRHSGLSWPEHVQYRLAMLRRDYAAVATITVPRDGLGVLDQSAVVVALRSNPAVYRGTPSWRRIQIALVRFVDRPARASRVMPSLTGARGGSSLVIVHQPSSQSRWKNPST